MAPKRGSILCVGKIMSKIIECTQTERTNLWKTLSNNPPSLFLKTRFQHFRGFAIWMKHFFHPWPFSHFLPQLDLVIFHNNSKALAQVIPSGPYVYWYHSCIVGIVFSFGHFLLSRGTTEWPPAWRPDRPSHCLSLHIGSTDRNVWLSLLDHVTGFRTPNIVFDSKGIKNKTKQCTVAVASF